jgi:class 3 adenylate cyclase
VNGQGPVDIVLVTGFVANILYAWEQPVVVDFLERIGQFARVIRFDRRGCGLSDRPREVPTLEARMDDVRAVMHGAESRQAVVLGTYEAAPMTALFAATYPERVGALVTYNGYAKAVWSPDYPWGRTEDEWADELAALEDGWATGSYIDRVLERSFPTKKGDAEFRRWFFNQMRYGASPSAAMTIQRMAMDVDVRDVLPAIRVPTLILHQGPMAGEARYMADRIPGAKRVQLAGADNSLWLARGAPEVLESFVDKVAGGDEPETVLATVLFTDIVGSTERATALGDQRWGELREQHHAVVRRHLDRFRGREVDTAGDGFFATFDGPARAIRCAWAIREAVGELGLEVRAGLHTGECELRGQKPGGIAVHIGARISAQAGPGEVLVSSTVKDLVAGSGIVFRDRGEVGLKGVPEPWRLFAVEGDGQDTLG